MTLQELAKALEKVGIELSGLRCELREHGATEAVGAAGIYGRREGLDRVLDLVVEAQGGAFAAATCVGRCRGSVH